MENAKINKLKWDILGDFKQCARIGNSQIFFQAKNAYSFDDYIVLHVTLAGIATALQAAAVPRFFAVGKTLTYLMEFYLTKFHESQQCR